MGDGTVEKSGPSAAPQSRRVVENDGAPAPWGVWVLAGLLVGIAGARVMVTWTATPGWAPQQWAMVNVMGIGPAGVILCDLAAMAIAAAAVAVGWRAGRGVPGWWLVLWAIGAALVAWHGTADADSARVGSTWMAGLAMAIGATAVGRWPGVRRWLVAGAIGLLVGLAAHGVWQVAVEHPQTVASYRADPEAALERMGVTPGGIEQARYEQRLFQNEATGRIGLANVYASVIMALTAMAGTLGGLALLRRRRPGLRSGILLGVAALGGVALAFSFSKGAVAAGIVTLSAVVCIAWLSGAFAKSSTEESDDDPDQSHPDPPKPQASRLKPLIITAIVLFALLTPWAAVIARGYMGVPETAQGERSLLFRGWYWSAGLQMVDLSPETGVGPGMFKEYYGRLKHRLSPEDVSDPHNVFVSYVATLGLPGLAWCGLLLAMIGRGAGWKAGKRESRKSGNEEESASAVSAGTWAFPVATGTAALVMFGVKWWVELAPLGGAAVMAVVIAAVIGAVVWRVASTGRADFAAIIGVAAAAALWWMLPLLGMWVVGLGGFIGIVWLVGRGENGNGIFDDSAVWLTALAGALAVLVHGQIEMTMTNAMAAPLACLLVGIVASAGAGGAPRRFRLLRRAAGAIGVIGAVAVGAWWVLGVAGPRVAFDQKLPVLTGTWIDSGAMPMDPLKSLAASDGADPRAGLWVTQAHTARLERQTDADSHPRTATADRLVEAVDAYLPDPTATPPIGSSRDRARLYRARAQSLAAVVGAARDKDLQKWVADDAREAADAFLDRQPLSAQAHLEMADLLWSVSDDVPDMPRRQALRARAARLYAEAIELNKNLYLEPTAGLPASDLSRAGERAADLDAAPSVSPAIE